MSRVVLVTIAAGALAFIAGCTCLDPTGLTCPKDDLPADRGVVGEGEGDSGRVSCGSMSEPGTLGDACDFTFTSCADGNNYEIACDTTTTCQCRISRANGSVDTTDFTITAQCSEFSVDDNVRLQAFAESNCSFVLDISEANIH